MNEEMPASHLSTALGCIAATLLFISVGFVVLFVWAWSGAHCQPAPQCQQGAGYSALGEVALLLGISTLLGFLVRWLARAIGRGNSESPAFSAVISTVVMLLLVWIAFKGTLHLMVYLMEHIR
ncbi:hypothetical protein K9B35_05215 [Sphingomonas sp. R647]|uniref:hypothetical protein n=1 Tax=Sphingomonas sp. R647 TaxID=2875233 RepID=UPI001CD53CE2|nr:hypothetical protein [Sphingomonas sp. R647]MCA1197357.1 hypothetical protein [Sphingomonas sp. R647]